ncbi:hypothetical protein Y032_0625g796 [Ancylostoma ceylanicum]|nr:hypothetical protein Y032_0625g796 [Ancylostoma ceylanicum]
MGLFIVYFDFELTPEIQINGSNVAVDSFNPIERCRSLHLNYMNDGADKEEIESVLEQIPLKGRTKCASMDELKERVSEGDGHYGFIFQSMHRSKLNYKMLTMAENKKSSRIFTPVFSE